MNKGEHVFQPGREHLEKRKDEIEQILKGPGRYELHRPGRKSIVLERGELIKQLKEVKAMIKAQKKFDKKTEPAIAQRKALRAELMKLPKSNLADLYLNLRFSEPMIKNFHIRIYKKALKYEQDKLASHKKKAETKYKNNQIEVEKALLEAKITITSKMTPGGIIAALKDKNIPLPLSDKPLRHHLAEIIKSRT